MRDRNEDRVAMRNGNIQELAGEVRKKKFKAIQQNQSEKTEIRFLARSDLWWGCGGAVVERSTGGRGRAGMDVRALGAQQRKTRQSEQ